MKTVGLAVFVTALVCSWALPTAAGKAGPRAAAAQMERVIALAEAETAKPSPDAIDFSGVAAAVDELLALAPAQAAEARPFLDVLEGSYGRLEQACTRTLATKGLPLQLESLRRVAREILRLRELVDGADAPSLVEPLERLIKALTLREFGDDAATLPKSDPSRGAIQSYGVRLIALLERRPELSSSRRGQLLQTALAQGFGWTDARLAVQASRRLVAAMRTLLGDKHSAYLQEILLESSLLAPIAPEYAATLLRERIAATPGQPLDVWMWMRIGARQVSDVAGLIEAARLALGDASEAYTMALIEAGWAYERAAEPELAQAAADDAATLVAEHHQENADLLYEQKHLAGVLHYELGRLSQAERVLRDAEAIARARYGATSEQAYRVLLVLIGVFASKGDETSVQGLTDQALRELEAAPASEAAQRYAATLRALRDNAAAAAGNAQAAIKVAEANADDTLQRDGPGSALYLDALCHVGAAYLAAGELQSLGQIFAQIATLLPAVKDTEGAQMADAMECVGLFAQRVRLLEDHDLATTLFERELAIVEKVSGSNAVKLGTVHAYLAQSYLELRNETLALEHLEKAEALFAKATTEALTTGSAAQRLAYVTKSYWFMDLAVTANAFPYLDDVGDAAADVAYTSALRLKGRALDVSADALAWLRQERAKASDLKKLAALHAEAARAHLKPAPGGRPLDAILTQIDELERSMNLHAGSGEATLAAPSVEAIRARIPAGALLLELVRFTPALRVDEANREPAYALYGVDATGLVMFGYVGKASTIDAGVADLRQALRACGAAGDACADADWQKRVAGPAKELGALVLGSAWTVLQGYDQLIIAPDGQLSLLPFAVLTDAQGRSLGETHRLSYVNSGRDLLRFAPAPAASEAGPPLILADPAFGESPRRAGVLADVVFEPLPGTATEAAAIKAVLPNAQIVSGKAATERALRSAAAPRILHVATHGFFIDEGAAGATEGSRGLKRRQEPATQSAVPETLVPESVSQSVAPQRELSQAEAVRAAGLALLRSGLALSGISDGPAASGRREAADDDGVMSALEVTDLDLSRTELVVLSACDTGVGAVSVGDGAYGLRRAFVLAGARNQLFSLWPVDDRATSLLMTELYRALAAGAAPAEALKSAQDALRRDPRFANPYYWAAFVASGEVSGVAAARSPQAASAAAARRTTAVAATPATAQDPALASITQGRNSSGPLQPEAASASMSAGRLGGVLAVATGALALVVSGVAAYKAKGYADAYRDGDWDKADASRQWAGGMWAAGIGGVALEGVGILLLANASAAAPLDGAPAPSSPSAAAVTFSLDWSF